MIVQDLGTMEYRAAWRLQEEIHARVLAGEEEQLLFVEHPPVITFGRRPGVAKNLIASADQLAKRGVDVVESDRGGDITFHGPGQLVVYPIITLADHGLSVSGYVHRLESLVIQTLAKWGVVASADPAAVGVWVDSPEGGGESKVAAIGVRIRKGVSLHGIALNVDNDLAYFDLIVPCGLVGRGVTSLAKLLGEKSPAMDAVKQELGQVFVAGLGRGG